MREDSVGDVFGIWSKRNPDLLDGPTVRHVIAPRIGGTIFERTAQDCLLS